MEKTIHEAILAVYNEVGYVQKTKSKELSYTFAGERSLIAALRPAMVEHGIIIHAKQVAAESEQYHNKDGKPFIHAKVLATFTFTHAISNTFIEVMSAGEASDYGDKATPKALTGAYKYALRQTFCIETGDDPDETSSEEYEQGSKKATNAKRYADTSEGSGSTETEEMADKAALYAWKALCAKAAKAGVKAKAIKLPISTHDLRTMYKELGQEIQSKSSSEQTE